MGPAELVDAVAVVGAVIVGLGAMVGAWVQIRAWVQEPFTKIEAALAAAHTVHAADVANLTAKIQTLTVELSNLQVHFDPNGGDLRGRITAIEKRLVALEVNGAAERAELRGLIVDLRPILEDLRELS